MQAVLSKDGKTVLEMPKFVGFQTIIVLDPNGITLKLQGSLVWPFNFYLNLAHYTGSQILNQTGQKFLAPFCTFCLKNNDDNALLSTVLKFTSIMDEKGWQKKRHAKNYIVFRSVLQFLLDQVTKKLPPPPFENLDFYPQF